MRALRRAGFEQVDSQGGHLIFKHPERPGRVPVPMHPRRTIKAGTLTTILEQARMTADELRELL
jgi:predicted RNA binding protein YcfA (HicA-like mRNA interferase family)